MTGLRWITRSFSSLKRYFRPEPVTHYISMDKLLREGEALYQAYPNDGRNSRMEVCRQRLWNFISKTRSDIDNDGRELERAIKLFKEVIK